MSTPNTNPSIPTQHAANLLARERQRNVPFAQTEAAYPEVFSPLSAAERQAARAFAREAYVAGTVIGQLQEDVAFGSVDPSELPARAGGLLDVTIGFGTRNEATGAYQAYRTVLVAYDPSLSVLEVGEAARGASYEYGVEVGDDIAEATHFEIRFVPFDLHR